MWTANITDVKKIDTTIAILVTYFKDGEFHSNISFENVDLPTVKTRILNRLNELKAIDSIDISSTKGSVDLTPLPTPVTPSPTLEQIFLADLSSFKQMKIAISLGLKTENDKDFTDLQTKLKNEFLSGYINLL